MKKNIHILTLTLLLSACGEPTKEQKLEELKSKLNQKQNSLADLKSEIEKIEIEITALNGKETQKGRVVETKPMKAAIFRNYLDIMGKIDAEETVNLSSEMPGTITKIYVRTGDLVSKGQVLAETDNIALTQSINDAELNLELINTLYEKQKSLWDQKIGTEVQFLQIKTQKESMEKKIAALKEQLRMTKIISPIEGTVDAVDVKPGNAIAPGMPAIRIVNMSKLKIKADIAEKFAPSIKKGNDVRVLIPDMNDSMDTKISYAAKTINTLNRTFTVEIDLNGNKDYHPNMFARLMISTYTSTQPVIQIPVKLIQRDGANNYVMVKKQDKAEKRILELGQTYNGITEVIKGINEGDEVITNGFAGLLDGENVYTEK